MWVSLILFLSTSFRRRWNWWLLEVQVSWSAWGSVSEWGPVPSNVCTNTCPWKDTSSMAGVSVLTMMDEATDECPWWPFMPSLSHSPHWIAPSPWMPDMQGLLISMSLTHNSSVWKTLFPSLHASTCPEWPSVKVAPSRKRVPIGNLDELPFARIYKSQVSVTRLCQDLLCAKTSSKRWRK